MATRRFKALFAVYAYQKNLLSLGKSALFAGMKRWTFIDFLSENNVPVIDFNEEELAEEFASAERLADKLRK